MQRTQMLSTNITEQINEEILLNTNKKKRLQGTSNAILCV